MFDSLSFLIDRRDLQAIDLVEIFGSEVAVDDAIAGRVNIDRSTADRLPID
jgi:hypothetical protein